MKKTTLKVDKRTVIGKKVKKLRKEGLLPATIYGKDVKSLSVQVPVKEFDKVYKEVGETGLVEISLDSEQARPVFIKNVQLDPRDSTPLHTDFYQVNLTEKIKAMVPVEAVGEPRAVLDKVGILEIPMAEIEVESLPTDVPEKITVDVSHLAAIGDQLKVADVKITSGVAVLTDPEQILFKIGELVSKEAEELAKAEEAAKAAAAAEAGAAEGAAPVEGEAPASAEATAGKPAEGEKPASPATGGQKEQTKPEEKS